MRVIKMPAIARTVLGAICLLLHEGHCIHFFSFTTTLWAKNPVPISQRRKLRLSWTRWLTNVTASNRQKQDGNSSWSDFKCVLFLPLSSPILQLYFSDETKIVCLSYSLGIRVISMTLHIAPRVLRVFKHPFPSPQGIPWRNWWGGYCWKFHFLLWVFSDRVYVCVCMFWQYWCLMCDLFFIKVIAFSGSWGYYWCFGRGVVKVGLTLACRRWFQVLCPGDVYANKKNALSSLQAKFRKIILALWIAKRKWKNRHGLGGRLGREEERKRR